MSVIYSMSFNDSITATGISFLNRFPDFSEVSETTRANIRQGKPVDSWIIQLLIDAPHIDKAKLTNLDSLLNEEVLFSRSSDIAQPSIVTVISSKGGVGKTTISSNLAVELSTRCRVALVDADVFTMGATHRYRKWLNGVEKPLSFVSLAIGEFVSAGRNPVSVHPDLSERDVTTGHLLFVPALISEHDEAIDSTPLVPPVLVDWNMTDASRAINKIVRQLSRLQLDTIVFDAHPGLLPLTLALCAVSDSCVLVTDDDAATMQANWMMAAEIQRRLLSNPRTTRKAEQSKSQTMDWFVAVNRIPSQSAAETCIARLESAREIALNEWSTSECPPETHAEIETRLSCHSPAFLLRDLYLIETLQYSPDVRQVSPRSRLYLGGVAGILATRRLVRSLILDGSLSQVEDRFLYAQRDNLDARMTLESYLMHYPEIRTPTQSMIGLTLLSWLLLLRWAFWLVSSSVDNPPISIMLSSVLLVILSVYAFVFVIRCAVRMVVWAVDLAATTGFWNLSFREQLRAYDGKALLYRVARQEPFGALVVWLFSLIVPGGIVGLLMLSRIDAVYSLLTLISSILVAVTVFWTVPEKKRVMRMMLVAVCRMNSSGRWRDVFRLPFGR